MSLRERPAGQDPAFTERPGLPSGAGLVLAADQDERADLAAYRRARRRARTRRLGTGALGLAVLAGIWQLVAMLLCDPVFLPSVSATAASFVHYFNRPYPAQGRPLWFDALMSLRRILIGFTAGTAIGVTLRREAHAPQRPRPCLLAGDGIGLANVTPARLRDHLGAVCGIRRSPARARRPSGRGCRGRRPRPGSDRCRRSG